MYFFELTKKQLTEILENMHEGAFNINGSILYDHALNEYHIKLLTVAGYRSKKPLIINFEYTLNDDGIVEIDMETGKELIANYTNLPIVYETPDEKFQREKTAGMIALAKRITDEIR